MPPSDPSNFLVSLVILVIISSLSAYYAEKKGRSPVAWFVIGLLISFFALLILYFLPSLKGNESNQASFPPKFKEPNTQLLPPPPPTALNSEEEKLWYYLDQNHQQYGPVSIIALKELWDTGRLDLNSYVWSEGMAKWEKIEDLSKLKEALRKPQPLL